MRIDRIHALVHSDGVSSRNDWHERGFGSFL